MLVDTIKKLENLYDVTNEALFNSELPKVVITLQSRQGMYGYCTNKKVWTINNEDNAYYELNLSPEYLDRSIDEIVATIIHEQIHVYCRVHGLHEARMNYHNRIFRDLALDHLLSVGTRDQKVGYGYTSSSTLLHNKLIELGININKNTFNVRRMIPPIKTQHINKKKDTLRHFACLNCGLEMTTRKQGDISLCCCTCNSMLIEFKK